MAVLELTPTTKLDAVNMMLASVGESPVNQIPDTGVTEATIAQDILLEVNKEVQANGAWFNTEPEVPLSPDQDGYINLPSNALEVDASDRTIDVVMRGSKLYDRANRTYIFTDTVKVDITYLLPFEDLPQTARTYIAIRAARRYQKNFLGSDTLHALSQEDEAYAYAAFRRSKIKNSDIKMTDYQPLFTTVRRR